MPVSINCPFCSACLSYLFPFLQCLSLLDLPHMEVAISRSEELDISKGSLWPEKIGTRVYLLLEELQNV